MKPLKYTTAFLLLVVVACEFLQSLHGQATFRDLSVATGGGSGSAPVGTVVATGTPSIGDLPVASNTSGTNIAFGAPLRTILGNETQFTIGTAEADMPSAPFGDNLPGIGDNHHFFSITDLLDDSFTAAITAYAASANQNADLEGIDAVSYATGPGANAVGATFGAYYDGGTNTGNFLVGFQGIAHLLSGKISPYISGTSVQIVNQGADTNVTSPAAWTVYAKVPYFTGGGLLPWTVQFYSDDLSGFASHVANGYYSWFDSRGVRRVKEDSTFNSVGQAIEALYNPQFTKYTAGATDFERIILGQWNGNVGELGVEKGGSGTLRKLRLIGSVVESPTGFSSLATDTPVAISSTGWTNSFGKSAVVSWVGTAASATVYNNAGTPVSTNTTVAGETGTILLQSAGKMIITAGSGIDGSATPF